MEQHKVLLIIVSVAVVLAAVVGVGLWLFYPRADDEAQLALEIGEDSQGFEWQPLDYLQGDGEVPGLDTAEEVEPGESDEFEVTYGTSSPADGQPSATPGPVIETQPQTPSEEGDAQTSPAVAAGETTQPTPVGPAEVVSAETLRNGTSSTAPAVTEPVVSSAGTSVASGAPAAAGTPSSTSSASDDRELADRAYWVQAISSPNRDTVEQAQRTLREHQLGSRIMTREIDGRTYYRLRVGPFAVRSEAEKFLAWVQAIPGFSDSMIFVDYTTPVLAAQAQ